MKNRYIILAALTLCAAGLQASAQSMYDAITFGRTEYIGSAHSLGMGNAVTAIGGDLGTIGINPAGSAVSSYNQMVFSPGLSISNVYASYSSDGGNTFGPASKATKTRFQLPNFGFSSYYDFSWAETPLKAVTFAFTCNSISDFNYLSNVCASTDRTSKFAEMASASTGIYPDSFESSNAYDNSNLYNYWDAIMAYKMGQISPYGSNNQYVGCTEALTQNQTTEVYSHWIPGALRQTVDVQKAGTVSDLQFNMGLNIENKLYLGLNIGTPVSEYRNVETVREVAIDPDMFPIEFTYSNSSKVNTCFDNAAYQYNYSATMAGLYLKIGAIYATDFGLRVGGAIKTRTDYSIDETWGQAGTVTYTNGTRFSGSTPDGSYSYRFYAPWEANFGLAYVLGHYGLVSVDYEIMDYSSMRFANYTTGSTEEFAATNEGIRRFCGASHNLRAGIEVNLTPYVSVRAGYNLISSPERYYYDERGNVVSYGDYMAETSYSSGRILLGEANYYGDLTRAFTLGAGYKSKDAFFVDFAVKYTRYPETIFSPYADYSSYQYDSATGDYIATASFYAPKVSNVASLINAVLSFGWRF